jgi:hypothetical protein
VSAINHHRVLYDCLLESGGDVEAAFAAAELILSEDGQRAAEVANPLRPRLIACRRAVASSATLSLDVRSKRAQAVLDRALKSARGLSAAARRDLAAALKEGKSGSSDALLKFLDKYRTQLARILTTTQLSAVLEGALEVAAKVPTLAQFPGAIPPPPTLGPAEALALVERLEKLTPEARAERLLELPPAEQVYVRQAVATRQAPPPVPPPILPPRETSPGSSDPGEVHLPAIDEAVRTLQARNVMDRQRYDALESAARAKAFTVANVESEEVLARVRDSLAESVREGASYDAWRDKVAEEVAKGTFLSDAHQETVFRTNVQSAFADGQESVLAHPLVRSGFPYRARDAIHDDRVREEHLALEGAGIGGTNVFRADDPVWQMFRAPWDYNCRCGDTPLTVRQAAERGIEEARKWLETGAEPSPPTHVPMPDFQPPPSFHRALAAAPLSVQLSMRPLGAFFAQDEHGTVPLSAVNENRPASRSFSNEEPRLFVWARTGASASRRAERASRAARAATVATGPPQSDERTLFEEHSVEALRHASDAREMAGAGPAIGLARDPIVDSHAQAALTHNVAAYHHERAARHLRHDPTSANLVAAHAAAFEAHTEAARSHLRAANVHNRIRRRFFAPGTFSSEGSGKSEDPRKRLDRWIKFAQAASRRAHKASEKAHEATRDTDHDDPYFESRTALQYSKASLGGDRSNAADFHSVAASRHRTAAYSHDDAKLTHDPNDADLVAAHELGAKLHRKAETLHYRASGINQDVHDMEANFKRTGGKSLSTETDKPEDPNAAFARFVKAVRTATVRAHKASQVAHEATRDTDHDGPYHHSSGALHHSGVAVEAEAELDRSKAVDRHNVAAAYHHYAASAHDDAKLTHDPNDADLVAAHELGAKLHRKAEKLHHKAAWYNQELPHKKRELFSTRGKSLGTDGVKPEEETDAAILYGVGEAGAPASGMLQTERRGPRDKHKGKRRASSKQRRRTLFKRLRVKRKWGRHKSATLAVNDLSAEQRDQRRRLVRAAGRASNRARKATVIAHEATRDTDHDDPYEQSRMALEYSKVGSARDLNRSRVVHYHGVVANRHRAAAIEHTIAKKTHAPNDADLVAAHELGAKLHGKANKLHSEAADLHRKVLEFDGDPSVSASFGGGPDRTGGGNWITIGGEPDASTGEKHVGGFRVKVDGSGRIVAGRLRGTKVRNVKKKFDALKTDEHRANFAKKYGGGDGGLSKRTGGPARGVGRASKPPPRQPQGVEGPVAGAPGGPGVPGVGAPRQGANQPVGPQAPQLAPGGQPAAPVGTSAPTTAVGRRAAAREAKERLKRLNARIDRYRAVFEKKGGPEVAAWFDELKEQIGSHGIEHALAALGDPKTTTGPARAQYEGAYDELGESQQESDFIKAYLDRAGINLIGSTGAPDPNLPYVGSFSKKNLEQLKREGRTSGGPNYVPEDATFKNKLVESQHLPGLESSEDVDQVAGQKVTQLTPDVIAAFDAKYGKGKWIVKSYGDEAYAGFGIFFPQRCRQIQRDGRAVVADARWQLNERGYKLARDAEGNLVGIKEGGTFYRFGSSEFDGLDKKTKRLAKMAQQASYTEGGARLPMSPEDSIRNNYGVSLRRDAAGVPVGITDWTGKDYDFGTPQYEKVAAEEGGAKGHDIHRAVEADEWRRNGYATEPKFMVQPAFEAAGVTDADRAAGATWETAKEGRVHAVVRDGKAQAIPYATLTGRGDKLPAVVQSPDILEMQKAVEDAINQLPESERRGQLYAPDVMKTKDGWKVVELNPSAEGGGSNWLGENPFVIDAVVSHLTGREPQHVKFIRDLLKKSGVAGPAPAAAAAAPAPTAAAPATKKAGGAPQAAMSLDARIADVVRRYRKMQGFGLSVDSGGREHKGKGKGGGQFVKKGGGASSGDESKVARSAAEWEPKHENSRVINDHLFDIADMLDVSERDWDDVRKFIVQLDAEPENEPSGRKHIKDFDTSELEDLVKEVEELVNDPPVNYFRPKILQRKLDRVFYDLDAEDNPLAEFLLDVYNWAEGLKK